MTRPLIILGAGLAGMSAALQAKKQRRPYLLLEKQDRPGGLVRSEKLNGFSFDYTGHLLHTREPRTRKLVLDELGLKDAFVPVQRDSWVYSYGRFTRAPFQANLFGLPPAVIRDCLDGMLRASRGPIKKPKPGFSDFETWNLKYFGEGIYKHFMEPYNTKLWGIHPSKMSTEFMGRFVPKPSLAQVFDGALRDMGKPMGYNANFIYPKRGGIETLAQGFAKKVQVQCGVEALLIDAKRKRLLLSDGQTLDYTKLISTMPLTKLIDRIAGVPARVKAARNKLRASSVLNVNLGIAGRNVSTKQWVYVPGLDLPFYRVGFYHNFSAALAPKGGSSVYAELSYGPERPINKKTAAAQVKAGLMKMGILRKSDKIAAEWVADIQDAYVVYDQHRTASVNTIQAWLKTQGIVSTGRWGNWEYAAMEDAIWQGSDAVAKF